MIGIFNIIVGFGQWGIKPGLEVSVFTNIVMVMQQFDLFDFVPHLTTCCSFFKLLFKRQ